MSQGITNLIETWAGMGLQKWAAHKYGWIVESSQPIKFSAWQSVVLGEYEQRKADVSTLLLSSVKKSGKTTISSLIICYRWLTLAGVHYVVANDQAQSQELQFNIISSMIERHPLLAKYSKVTKDTITFLPTGSRIVSLPYDAAGAAGANFATVSFSELWGFVYEQGQRLYEELTPIPLADCLRVIDSYAGYSNESELLQRIWDRGLEGERISSEWPIYLIGQQLSYIHTGTEAQIKCWRGTEAQREAYYQEQKASLRPMSYRRLHLNEWSAGAESFLEAEQVEAITNSALSPLPPHSQTRGSGVIAVRLGDWYNGLYDEDDLAPISAITTALDLATKQDHAALSGVYFDYEAHKIRLAFHYIWQPPVEIGEIEAQILNLNSLYDIGLMAYDPFQAAYLAQRLSAAGLPMQEFTQTVPNLKASTEAFFSLINSKRFEIYPSDEVKQYLLNSKIKELPDGSGYRLVKGSQSKKIDLAVTLAWASYFCNQFYGEG